MRWFERLVAWAGGYFWLPCPVCGEMFGGHEIAHVCTGALVSDDGHAHCVCPKPECSYEAGARNAIAGHAIFLRHNAS